MEEKRAIIVCAGDGIGMVGLGRKMNGKCGDRKGARIGVGVGC